MFSLFESPRSLTLWRTSPLTEKIILEPMFWSRPSRRPCLSANVRGMIPFSCLSKSDPKYLELSFPPLMLPEVSHAGAPPP